MTITVTKRIIKIGSSWGNTLPQKELKQAGAKPGDDIKVTIEVLPKLDKKDQIMNEYDAFIKQYGQTLKNLADRRQSI